MDIQTAFPEVPSPALVTTMAIDPIAIDQGYYELGIAVVARAIDDILAPLHPHRTDAIIWLRSDGQKFVENLGYDPDGVRRWLDCGCPKPASQKTGLSNFMKWKGEIEMTVKEEVKPDLRAIRADLAAIEYRAAEIDRRLHDIYAEVDAFEIQLGKTSLEGGDTRKIHADLAKLDQDHRELVLAQEAARIALAGTRLALQKAETEAAMAEYKALAGDIGPRGIRIFKQLDCLHLELAELLQLQDKAEELRKSAGAIPFDPAEGSISVPVPKIWRQVFQSIDTLISWNGREALARNGIRIPPDYEAEYTGQKKPAER
jgi:hypothetical protein